MNVSALKNHAIKARKLFTESMPTPLAPRVQKQLDSNMRHVDAMLDKGQIVAVYHGDHLDNIFVTDGATEVFRKHHVPVAEAKKAPVGFEGHLHIIELPQLLDFVGEANWQYIATLMQKVHLSASASRMEADEAANVGDWHTRMKARRDARPKGQEH